MDSGERDANFRDAVRRGHEANQPTARDILVAAAIMLGTAFEKDAQLREWTEGAVAKQHLTFRGADKIQRASRAILAEIDQPGESPLYAALTSQSDAERR